jgi:hypothetical protein
MALKRSLYDDETVYWVEVENSKNIPFIENPDGVFLYRGKVQYTYESGRYYVNNMELLFSTDDKKRSKYGKRDADFHNQDTLFDNLQKVKKEMIRMMFQKQHWM